MFRVYYSMLGIGVSGIACNPMKSSSAPPPSMFPRGSHLRKSCGDCGCMELMCAEMSHCPQNKNRSQCNPRNEAPSLQNSTGNTNEVLLQPN